MSDATTIDAGGLPPPAPPEGSRRAYLVVREGDRTQVIDLGDGDDVVLGRSSEATVQLDDARASREHARVRRRGDALSLQDLGGRNGTRLNQELVRGDERAVRNGDVIRIGEAEIIVAESAAERREVDRGGRLEAELSRLLATGGGRAAIVRISVDATRAAALLAQMAPALAAAELVEAQSDHEYACLLTDGDETVVARVVAELRRLAPDATVEAARAPADGSTLAELWRKTGDQPPRPTKRGAAEPAAPPGVIVADAAMVRVYEIVRKVAQAPTTVLILGETGVGKEVVAEQIHLQSPRTRGPFVRLNCSSLPETLLESELFGHERGAFTGAERRKQGYLEAADGGTLFLDEIGELAQPLQAKLLRVIEGRRFMRVGGREEIAVDVRILSATNRDLETEVKAGRFREDLYFRLSAFVVRIPPLRERRAEVALLAELFARQFAARMGAAPPRVEPDATRALAQYAWPGNVRELRNAIEHAVVLSDGGALKAEHLPESLRRGDVASHALAGGAMREQLADLEHKAIEEALAAEGGNQTRAAKRLGISRRALIYKLEKFGIKR